MPSLTIQIHDGLEELARRIDSGEIAIVADAATIPAAAVDTTLDFEGLRGLALCCDDQGRSVEAARIRRWLGEDHGATGRVSQTSQTRGSQT